MLYIHLWLYIILICTAMSVVSAKVKDQESYKLPPEILVKAQKFSVPCIEESNANPDILRNLVDSTIEDDDASKQFVYCFSVKGKFTDEEGHFNISRMSGLLGDHPLKKPIEDALAECNNITKESPLETAFAMNSCLNNNAPVVFAL